MADRKTFARKPVTAWGEPCRVRALTAGESISLVDFAMEKKYQGEGAHQIDMARYDARLVVLALEDSEGNQVFQTGDEKLVLLMPGADFATVVDAARELNGLNGKAREDAEKN